MDHDQSPERLRLRMSRSLFRVLTECVRRVSNATLRIEQAGTLLSTLLSAGLAQLGDTTIALDHLRSQPAGGDIVVDLELSPAAAHVLPLVREAAAAAVGKEISLEELVSILLFNRLVEDEVQPLVARLEAALDKVDSCVAPPPPRLDNVLPFPSGQAGRR